jgi:hypothetical protein
VNPGQGSVCAVCKWLAVGQASLLKLVLLQQSCTDDELLRLLCGVNIGRPGRVRSCCLVMSEVIRWSCVALSKHNLKPLREFD